jgi:hypothetical protein
MNQREKFINAIKDCSLTKIDTDQMEVYAGMFTDDLALEVVNELYSLKSEYDSLQAIYKKTDRIAMTQIMDAETTEINLESNYNGVDVPLRTGAEFISKMDSEDAIAYTNQLNKSITGVDLPFVMSHKFGSFAQMLRSSFTFSNTEQGFEFWNNMVNKYGNDI